MACVPPPAPAWGAGNGYGRKGLPLVLQVLKPLWRWFMQAPVPRPVPCYPALADPSSLKDAHDPRGTSAPWAPLQLHGVPAHPGLPRASG